jgi:hypothetical protein
VHLQDVAVAEAVELVVGVCAAHAADQHHLLHARRLGRVDLQLLRQPVDLLRHLPLLPRELGPHALLAREFREHDGDEAEVPDLGHAARAHDERGGALQRRRERGRRRARRCCGCQVKLDQRRLWQAVEALGAGLAAHGRDHGKPVWLLQQLLHDQAARAPTRARHHHLPTWAWFVRAKTRGWVGGGREWRVERHRASG